VRYRFYKFRSTCQTIWNYPYWNVSTEK